MHPSGRQLLALTKRSSLAALDAKTFMVERQYAGPKCQTHPLQFAVSPDGRYIACGSEDGHLWVSGLPNSVNRPACL